LIDWLKRNLEFLFLFLFNIFRIAGHWDIDRLVNTKFRIYFYFIFFIHLSVQYKDTK